MARCRMVVFVCLERRRLEIQIESPQRHILIGLLAYETMYLWANLLLSCHKRLFLLQILSKGNKRMCQHKGIAHQKGNDISCRLKLLRRTVSLRRVQLL